MGPCVVARAAGSEDHLVVFNADLLEGRLRLLVLFV